MRAIKKYLVSTVVMLFVACMVTGIQAEAAPGKVTGVKQTDDWSDSYTIMWKDMGASEYNIYEATTEKGTYKDIGYAKQNGVKVKRGAGESYWVQVAAVIDGEEGPRSDAIEVVTAPSGVTTSLSQTAATKTSVSVKWNAVSKATGYQVSYTDGATDKTKYTNKTNEKITELKADKKYAFYVAAYKESKSGYKAIAPSGKYSYSVKTLSGKVTGLKAYDYNINGTFDFKYTAKKQADGYQIQVYEKNKKTKVKAVTINRNSNGISVKNKKLAKNKVYSARIKAYVNVNGKKVYSDWSDFTYFSRQPKQSAKEVSNGVKISWPKITGATNYTVAISKKLNSGYKKVGTTKKNNVTIKKYGKSNLVKGQRYYVTVVANTKVGKKVYKSPNSYYLAFTR